MSPKKRTKKAAASASQIAVLLREAVASRLVWALVVIATVYFGAQALRRGLARDRRFYAVPVRIKIRGPAWGDAAIVTPVSERLEALGPINLFDGRFEERIREALDEVPGVRRVVGIRRLWPRRYAVDVVLHRPHAVVRSPGVRIPVTADRTRLPSAPYENASKNLFVVTGVASRPPEAGKIWRDASLSAGLAALAQIEPYFEELAPLGLSRIDVSGATESRRGVVIYGIDGIRVRWGRPHASVRENPVETKIAFLLPVASDIERVRGKEIDVRFGTLYLRELSEL